MINIPPVLCRNCSIWIICIKFLYKYKYKYVYTHTHTPTPPPPHTHTETEWKQQFPFVCCRRKRKRKTEVCFPSSANDKPLSTITVPANVHIYAVITHEGILLFNTLQELILYQADSPCPVSKWYAVIPRIQLFHCCHYPADLLWSFWSWSSAIPKQMTICNHCPTDLWLLYSWSSAIPKQMIICNYYPTDLCHFTDTPLQYLNRLSSVIIIIQLTCDHYTYS